MKIGIIGAGNMASALLEGFLTSEIAAPTDICISDKDEKKLSVWKTKGVCTTDNNDEVLEFADVVVFAVKPNILPLVLKDAGKRTDNKIYISIAAGFSIEKIESYLGNKARIVRVMPNTPALVRCGMSVVCFNKNADNEASEIVKKLFSSVGEVVFLEEKFMNSATAVHSCSPAFVYMMIDAMADAGLKYGIDKKSALLLAAKAVEGSAKMVLESNELPNKLKDNVCSPGGATIEGVLELEKNGFKSDIQSAIKACVEKAEKL